MFRRAVLLRSLLEVHAKDIFDKNTKEARIDLGVIRAFLNVKRFEHESRSMQAIIEMSRVTERGYFHKSSLPAKEQMKMHVNADEFCQLMDLPVERLDDKGATDTPIRLPKTGIGK
jgi:hypothetical protein